MFKKDDRATQQLPEPLLRILSYIKWVMLNGQNLEKFHYQLNPEGYIALNAETDLIKLCRYVIEFIEIGGEITPFLMYQIFNRVCELADEHQLIDILKTISHSSIINPIFVKCIFLAAIEKDFVHLMVPFALEARLELDKPTHSNIKDTLIKLGRSLHAFNKIKVSTELIYHPYNLVLLFFQAKQFADEAKFPAERKGARELLNNINEGIENNRYDAQLFNEAIFIMAMLKRFDMAREIFLSAIQYRIADEITGFLALRIFLALPFPPITIDRIIKLIEANGLSKYTINNYLFEYLSYVTAVNNSRDLPALKGIVTFMMAKHNELSVKAVLMMLNFCHQYPEHFQASFYLPLFINAMYDKNYEILYDIFKQGSQYDNLLSKILEENVEATKEIFPVHEYHILKNMLRRDKKVVPTPQRPVSSQHIEKTLANFQKNVTKTKEDKVHLSIRTTRM